MQMCESRPLFRQILVEMQDLLLSDQFCIWIVRKWAYLLVDDNVTFNIRARASINFTKWSQWHWETETCEVGPIRTQKRKRVKLQLKVRIY